MIEREEEKMNTYDYWFDAIKVFNGNDKWELRAQIIMDDNATNKWIVFRAPTSLLAINGLINKINQWEKDPTSVPVNTVIGY